MEAEPLFTHCGRSTVCPYCKDELLQLYQPFEETICNFCMIPLELQFALHCKVCDFGICLKRCYDSFYYLPTLVDIEKAIVLEHFEQNIVELYHCKAPLIEIITQGLIYSYHYDTFEKYERMIQVVTYLHAEYYLDAKLVLKSVTNSASCAFPSDLGRQNLQLRKFKMLLKQENVRELLQDTLVPMARYGLDKQLQIVLKQTNLLPTIEKSKPIRIASYYGHQKVVEVLLEDNRSDFSAMEDYAIRYAARNGHVEVVKLLLQQPDVNPSARMNDAIQMACQSGYHDIVQILLGDPRVDPSASSCYGFRMASLYGYLDTVKLLLSDPRIDPTVDGNYSILSAFSNGHLEVGYLLLNDTRINVEPIKGKIMSDIARFGTVDEFKDFCTKYDTKPAEDNNDALVNAARYGNKNVVHHLLQMDVVLQTPGLFGAFICAARAGHVDTFEVMMNCDTIDPTSVDNYLLRHLSMLQPPIAKSILMDPRVDITIWDNYPLKRACMYNSPTIVETILQHPKCKLTKRTTLQIFNMVVDKGYFLCAKKFLQFTNVKPSASVLEKALLKQVDECFISLLLSYRSIVVTNRLIALAVQYVSPAIIEEMVAKQKPEEFMSPFCHNPIVEAATKGNIEMVRRLTQLVKYSTPILEVAVNRAAEHGFLNIVKYIVHNFDVKIDFSLSCAFTYACLNGHHDVVQYMINTPNFNPAAKANTALISASKKGHAKIVQLLLKDGRVNPNAQHCAAMKHACTFGYDKVLAYLLEDKRTDVQNHGRMALQVAAAKGYTKVVQLLLQKCNIRIDNSIFFAAVKSGVSPTVELILQYVQDDNNTCHILNMENALIESCKNGYIQIVDQLMCQKDIDPSVQFNAPLCHASLGGHIAIVRALLQSGKVNAAVPENKCFRLASRAGHMEVVKRLLQDTNVDPCAHNCYALRWAVRNRHYQIGKLLLLRHDVRQMLMSNAYMKRVYQSDEPDWTESLELFDLVQKGWRKTALCCIIRTQPRYIPQELLRYILIDFCSYTIGKSKRRTRGCTV